MIISELQLYNFRKFKCVDDVPGLTVTFHKGLNALIGENDSGKTALIDAMRCETIRKFKIRCKREMRRKGQKMRIRPSKRFTSFP